MSIYLTAIVKSRPGHHEALKAVLLNMVALSRKEAACMQYQLHETEDKTAFIFHEEWQSRKGLDDHNAQPYIIDFITRSETLADAVVLYQTEKLA